MARWYGRRPICGIKTATSAYQRLVWRARSVPTTTTIALVFSFKAPAMKFKIKFCIHCRLQHESMPL